MLDVVLAADEVVVEVVVDDVFGKTTILSNEGESSKGTIGAKTSSCISSTDC